jgi:aminoglycoside phosphotransferase (APT) family kinase protein
MMTTLKLFKELKQAEIKAVITDLYGNTARITECWLMEGGLFNTTYHIQTDADHSGLVLRVAPVNRQLLFDFEKSMMSAEPIFFEMLAEKKIPTSEVVHYDNSFNVIEREYILFRYIPSLPMNNPDVPQEAKPALNQRVGEILALMHGIKGDQFGWKRPGGTSELFDRWGTFLKRFASEIAERSANYGVFKDAELSGFTQVFEDSRVFDQVRQACMVHTDLWEGNVLVQQNEGEWGVAAIIDVDRAVFGDPDMEFNSAWALNPDLLRGYGRRLGSSPEANFRRQAYDLLWEFMYAYVWFVQYENMARYEVAKRRGLDTLDLLIAPGRGGDS